MFLFTLIQFHWWGLQMLVQKMKRNLSSAESWQLFLNGAHGMWRGMKAISEMFTCMSKGWLSPHSQDWECWILPSPTCTPLQSLQKAYLASVFPVMLYGNHSVVKLLKLAPVLKLLSCSQPLKYTSIFILREKKTSIWLSEETKGSILRLEIWTQAWREGLEEAGLVFWCLIQLAIFFKT